MPPDPEEKVGHKLDNYINQARKRGLVINFPKKFCNQESRNFQLCRQELIDLCKSDADPLFCFCAIMAWGMRKDHYNGWKHFDSAISDPKKLEEKIRKIKEAKSRQEVFGYLNGCGRIPGLGIPFFTKLIFFFRGDGYILDQWTAKSAKLLAPALSINVYKTGPAPNNTSKQYEEFCKFVEELAEKMGNHWKPSHSETGMFGGRKNKSEWRRYVISQMRSPSSLFAT